jgi:hypothetical protein
MAVLRPEIKLSVLLAKSQARKNGMLIARFSSWQPIVSLESFKHVHKKECDCAQGQIREWHPGEMS